MKKLYIVLISSIFAISLIGPTVSAQQYAMTEEQYRQAELDNQQNQADIQEYELESKVATAEEQEKTEANEAAEANGRLLLYILVGAGILAVVFTISHEVQKPRPKKQ